MKLSDFEGISAWTRNWLAYTESYRIESPKLQIDFFGGVSDDAYLVIDVFTAKLSCTEYIFLADQEADEGRSMALIFNFLFTLDYSLQKLLTWLESAEFEKHALGERILIGGLTIERRFPVSN